VIDNFRGSLPYGPDPSFAAITGGFKLQQQVGTKTDFIHELWLKVGGMADIQQHSTDADIKGNTIFSFQTQRDIHLS